MKKTVTSLALAITIILSISITGGQTLAADKDSGNTPITAEAGSRYTLIISANPTLSVSGTTASYTLTTTSISSVSSTKATLQLQIWDRNYNRWVDYSSSWTASSQSNILSTSGTRSVAYGFSYRLKAIITATSGTNIETITVYS